MPLEIKKSERENSQSLIRRFGRRMKKSGILLNARKGRFHKREKSEQMKKRSALRKEEKRKKYEKMRKLGQLR
jgi:hypothetical protein